MIRATAPGYTFEVEHPDQTSSDVAQEHRALASWIAHIEKQSGSRKVQTDYPMPKEWEALRTIFDDSGELDRLRKIEEAAILVEAAADDDGETVKLASIDFDVLTDALRDDAGKAQEASDE